MSIAQVAACIDWKRPIYTVLEAILMVKLNFI